MNVDLGIIKPGKTQYIPFHTFDSNDPSASVTITGLAVTDIEIYKDGGVTQRASDAGYTLLDTDGIDFDGTTGIHGFSVDLADNTTANFYEAGSHYTVVVASITVDAATINFIPVTFTIGYPDAILNTTIATLSTQTSFTLEEGPADDDALNGCPILVHDLASAIQMCIGYVSDYTGSSKTVTLAADPAIFTMAAGDNASFFIPANVMAVNGTAQTAGDIPALVTTVDTVVDGIQTDLSNGTDGLGAIKADTAATLVDTNELQGDWTDAGRLDAILDAVLADTAVIGAPVGASISADIAVVDGNVDDIETAVNALNDLSFADVWTGALTESYNTDGSAFTGAQALYLLAQMLTEMTISGTTMTIKKLDGTTTAFTLTLDDGTNPTSITRAT